jgi:uracil-DNA glycosylase family 4
MAPASKLAREWATLNERVVACRNCPRLIEHCQTIAATKRAAYRDWDYWGRPVPNFGDPAARLLLVGLAPGAHGSNRTGRMFTGDASGDWLYRALHRAGFANQPHATSADDGLQLIDCAITAAVHCAPPDNMPTPAERTECRRWLEATIDASQAKVFVALGGVGWQAIIREAKRKGWHAGTAPKFGHLEKVPLAGGRWLVGSYHPSRQNTNTGRLTEAMLDDVFALARRLLDDNAPTRSEVNKRSAGRK